MNRRLPVGAELSGEGGAHFRVWAPRRERVEVEVAGAFFALEQEEGGYFSGLVDGATAGSRYRYRLDGTEICPDPASRFQPEGPHGPSEIVDPSQFRWTDNAWRGLEAHNNVIYELHIGAFTEIGTWRSAAEKLPFLAETGITILEIMPVADFSGRFGWGYDGVNWFAPSRLYGRPDDMRHFVDLAHSHGLAVILDVVYNHLGPDGNYLGHFSSDYVTKKYTTDWGEAINYDGPNSTPVREFVQANAAYWIKEFHLDGLRLDATQNVYDDSEDHILRALARSAREAAGKRRIMVVAENEPQEARFVRSAEQGGFGIDALWNDDFHHSAIVAMTGHNDAYYMDYRGTPQEFISAMKYGYLYQGQWYAWQKQRRGSPSLDIPRNAFVTFIENHDQVANSARGLRAHQLAAPGVYRAMIMLTLLGPGTPMLFQGQEFAASAPFLFFADMPEWLRTPVREGRKEFMRQWRSMRDTPMLDGLPDPASPETFLRCKLDHSEREKHQEAYRLHRDLIRLRRTDRVLSRVPAPTLDGAVLSSSAFLLRFFGGEAGERLLIFNLGRDLHLQPAPEPLLAPPAGHSWSTLLSTEAPEYGGSGVIRPEENESEWIVSGNSAILFGEGPQQKIEKIKKETAGE